MCYLINAFAIKFEDQGSRSSKSGFGSAESSRVDYMHARLGLLKNMGVKDNNICSKSRALELNTKLVKFFLHIALPFNLI